MAKDTNSLQTDLCGHLKDRIEPELSRISSFRHALLIGEHISDANKTGDEICQQTFRRLSLLLVHDGTLTYSQLQRTFSDALDVTDEMNMTGDIVFYSEEEMRDAGGLEEFLQREDCKELVSAAA